ncbi:YbhB/YbcL family Raf kinase inhibitor-like protein [Povalibacter sp.]
MRRERRTHYPAPDPPPGHGAHRYVFQIFRWILHLS